MIHGLLFWLDEQVSRKFGPDQYWISSGPNLNMVP
jgi:hypothetical protein